MSKLRHNYIISHISINCFYVYSYVRFSLHLKGFLKMAVSEPKQGIFPRYGVFVGLVH